MSIVYHLHYVTTHITLIYGSLSVTECNVA